MSKFFKILVAVASLSLFASPANAQWSVEHEGSGSSYFIISSDEVVSTPVIGNVYAIVEDGIVTKVVTWTPMMIEDIILSMPDSYGVKYVDLTQKVKVEPINHGDKVYVEIPGNRVVKLDEKYSGAPVVNRPVVEGDAEITKPDIVRTSVNADYSTSLTVTPVINNDPNKIVSVQVISNGMSFTSITTDNSSAPITINNLPENSFVTVQTVVRDISSGEETIIQGALAKTPDVDIPVIANSRNVSNDKASISSPVVTSVKDSDSGVRTATISVDSIPDFDSTKSLATVMVVSKSGSVTSIGVDGNGGSVNLRELSSTEEYSVKLVIRDIDSGEETIISGSELK